MALSQILIIGAGVLALATATTYFAPQQACARNMHPSLLQSLPNLYRFLMTVSQLISNLYTSLNNLASTNSPKEFTMKNATIITLTSATLLTADLMHNAMRRATQAWETFVAHQYGGPF